MDVKVSGRDYYIIYVYHHECSNLVSKQRIQSLGATEPTVCPARKNLRDPRCCVTKVVLSLTPQSEAAENRWHVNLAHYAPCAEFVILNQHHPARTALHELL